jgi:hypothetical protein
LAIWIPAFAGMTIRVLKTLHLRFRLNSSR